MIQSLLYHAFGIREGYEYRSTTYVEERIEFHLRVEKKSLVCPDCRNSAIHWSEGRPQRAYRAQRDGAGGEGTTMLSEDQER